MKAIPFALLLIGVSISYFIVRVTTSLGDVTPLPVVAAFIGGTGVCIFIAGVYAHIDHRLNRRPQPPFFMMDTTHRCCLELASDGSYESCRDFLSTLEKQFQAEYSEHMDAGPFPHSDKDKGYWNVKMFGQEFFVMRHRGHGLCIWGPEAPTDFTGFLRVASHFDATEFRTWQQNISRLLRVSTRHSVAKAK